MSRPNFLLTFVGIAVQTKDLRSEVEQEMPRAGSSRGQLLKAKHAPFPDFNPPEAVTFSPPEDSATDNTLAELTRSCLTMEDSESIVFGLPALEVDVETVVEESQPQPDITPETVTEPARRLQASPNLKRWSPPQTQSRRKLEGCTYLENRRWSVSVARSSE